MATLMQYIPQFANTPLVSGLEPNDVWKQTLKRNIEAGLRFMVDEAKQKLNNELGKGVIGPEERERLTTDHLATLKRIRQLADEQFQITLELERRERWWASGEQVDRTWSEHMKEQQAILDGIEMNRKNKPPATSLQSDPPQFPPRLSSLPPPSFRFQSIHDVLPSGSSAPAPLPSNSTAECVDRTPTQMPDPERDELSASPDEISSFRPTREVRAGSITSIGSWKAPSILDTEKTVLERSKPSTVSDEPKFLPRTPTTPPGLAHEESIQRKPRTNARPVMQEFWKPSITPEEDAQMSRTFTLAGWHNILSAASSFKASSILSATPVPPPSANRVANKRLLPSITSEKDSQTSQFMFERWSSTASATPSFKAPSILSVAFTDPLEALSADVDRERSSIYSMGQEWSSSDEARERDGEHERPGHGHTDDRLVHSSNQRLEDRIGFSQLPATSPSSMTYPRAEDISRIHVPPPSMSRPIVNERSLPSITPEEDVQMSRSVMLARRSGTATPSFKAPSILSVAFTDPLEALSADVDRERTSIYYTDQEWNSSDQAQEKDRERERPGHGQTDDRSVHSSTHRFENRIRFSRLLTSPTSSATYPQPGDSSRVHLPEAQFKEEVVWRRIEEAFLKAEETWKKEVELCKREEELKRREEDLNRREAEIRRREHDELEKEPWKRMKKLEREKPEIWPRGTSRPSPSPRMSNPSGPWPTPDRDERSTPATVNSFADRVSTSTSSRGNPTSGQSSASMRSASVTSNQPSGTPRPTGSQQRVEQSGRRQAGSGIQEYKRQAKTSKTMSKEEVAKLLEAHRNQWDKIRNLGSLIWEDFPWPMFKRPKGSDDLTSPDITAYMLSSIHPQDRATKDRIKDDIRRWHPDRFSSQLLPKVKESERERVSEGAGTVVKVLNDLLRMHSQGTF